ncbi:hypothetical protein [Streptomyces sp. NPDC021212]
MSDKDDLELGRAGEIVQRGSTSDLLSQVPEPVANLSRTISTPVTSR